MQTCRKIFKLFVVLAVLTTVCSSLSIAAERIDCEAVINSNAKLTDSKQRYKTAYCLINRNFNKEGLRFLKDLEKELPLITEYILFYRAKAYMGLNNYQEAMALYNRILSEYPQSTLNDLVLLNISIIDLRYKRYDDAEKIYQKLYGSQKDPDQKAFYLYRIAFIQKNQENYQDSQSTFIKLWRDYPLSIYSTPSYKEAISIQSKYGIKMNVTENDYLKRAQILFTASKWQSAIENYTKSPLTQAVLINKAICYVNTNMYSQALLILKKINTATSIFWRAKILSKQNKNTAAAEMYIKIYAKYPESFLAPESLFNAARLYEIDKNDKKALSIYELLIAKYSKSNFAEEGSWNLGWIYYKKGDLAKAKKTFSAFINTGSSFNASRSEYWTARILETLGYKQQAQKIYYSLAGKYFPSYYPYLAQLKTGYDTSSITTEIGRDMNTTAGPNRAKAELFIEMGMLDEAKMELDKINRTAKDAGDYIDMSILYSKVDDYYNSIKVVQGIDHPLAMQLSYPKGYSKFVEKYSGLYGVDKYMVYSIIREESRYQPDVVSPANAIGLMQLLPSTGSRTARSLGISNFDKKDLYIPETNIRLGINYLKTVLDQFNGNVFFALGSYNAGPDKVSLWISRNPGLEMDEFVEEIPFRETRNYVRRVLRTYGAYKAIYDKNQNLTSRN